MLYKLKNNVENHLSRNLLEFSAIIFALGILIYFSSTKFTISIYLFLIVLSLYLLGYVFKTKHLNILLTILILGYLAAYIKTNNLDSTSISKEIKNAKITGIIENIKTTYYGTQYLISNVKLNNKEVPFNIRLYNTKKPYKYLARLDKIYLKADLKPPSTQIVPSGYDFTFISYFKNIGATGKITSRIRKLNKHNNKYDFASKSRNLLLKIFKDKLGYKYSSIASGIFIGETSAIPRQILENVRYSGISHIMCVSGLHLSVVAMFFYFNLRIILNFSNYIAYNYDIKKIAAILAIIFSFFYLSITGFQTAAFRAFIMVSIILISVIFSKDAYPMRSLALACIVILTIWPEQILQPSFQLSFIAVSALLSAFNKSIEEDDLEDESKIQNSGFIYKLIKYIKANFYSSFIASISTTPIVAYHFYIFSSYTIIANLIIVPFVSFLLIPLGIISIFLYKFPFSGLLFLCLKYCLIFVEQIAEYFKNIPNSVIYTGYISNLTISIYICGYIIFIFSQRYLKIVGILIIAVSFITYYHQKKPDYLVNFDNNFVAVYKNNQIKIYGKTNRYITNFVANWFGDENAYSYKLEQFKSNNIKVDFNKNHILFGNKIHKTDHISAIYINDSKIIDYRKSNIRSAKLMHKK